MKNEKLGMDSGRELYAYAVQGMMPIKEYFITHKFIKKFVKEYAKQECVDSKDIEWKFISFGYRAVIFVMKHNDTYKTLTVANPHYGAGTLKAEVDRLNEFANRESGIVKPECYFSSKSVYGDRELMMTDYFYQARSISNLDGDFGIYIPEPEYRFVATDNNQTSVLKSAIIAKLVASFDMKKQKGISKVEVISGDFILEKGWEKAEPSIQNVYDKMKLITVRGTVGCTLDEYVNLIRKEFVQNTDKNGKQDFTANEAFVLNTCSYVPFSKEDIENGISYGLKQLQSKNVLQDNLIINKQ